MKLLYKVLIVSIVGIFSCNFALANNAFFIQNKGQVKNERGQEDLTVLFTYSSPELDVFVREKGITYQFKRYNQEGAYAERVDVNWEGCASGLVANGVNQCDYTENYFLNGNANSVKAFRRSVFQMFILELIGECTLLRKD